MNLERMSGSDSGSHCPGSPAKTLPGKQTLLNTVMNIQLYLKFYYDHVLTQVYSEGDSPFHRHVTGDVVTRFIDPLSIEKDAVILDLGCGPGYFLEEMQKRGYTNTVGITANKEDIDICQQKQLKCRAGDMNFLDQTAESVDLLFCRHAIEHSPFPYFSLLEYNRVLKPRGKLYIEVPAPDGERVHENNLNHYSIMGRQMWLSLLKRSGFDVDWYDYEFPIKHGGNNKTYTEKYYIFVCTRTKSVDVK